MDERIREPELQVRRPGEARFVITARASFFVPGEIYGPGRRPFRLRALHGELLGRPIVTIPPEEAD